MSQEFISLTYFFLVNSFCMNFYIGTFDMQLGDIHDLTLSKRHLFAETFTLIITLGVLVIPIVGAMMDRIGFPTTSLVCITSGIIWIILLLFDSSKWHLLKISFIFYSIYRTAFFTFFFAYLADVLGFAYFGMLGGIIFLFAGILGMLQYPLALYAAGNCHLYETDPYTCDKGNWSVVNTIMLLFMFSTYYFTYQDYIHRNNTNKMNEMTINNTNNNMNEIQMSKTVYGAV